MDSFTAGVPFSRAHSRCSWWVSATLATSVSGMRPRPGTGSSTFRTSSMLRNLPAVFPITSRVADATRPAAMSWFALRSDSMTWETVSPYERSRSWSRTTWISRTRPPETSTDATPSMVSSCGRSRYSTQSRSEIRSRVPDEKPTS